MSDTLRFWRCRYIQTFFLLGLMLSGSDIQASMVTQPTSKPQAAVASAHPLATDAGLKILQQGGNAFDAAVTVSAVLAVVEPYSSGLGGGGFWLLHRHQDGFETMIDGRERAPMKASHDMYLDKHGDIIKGLSINGPLAAGIPGEPAALAHIAEHYGNLPLKTLLESAIQFAKNGFPANPIYQRMASIRLNALKDSDDAKAIFLDHEKAPEPGTIIRQPDLANTLTAIATQGHDGFYKGQVAKALVKGVQDKGGIWTEQDLADYKIIEREPVKGKYRDIEITTAALPSSGGIVLLEILNQLEHFDLESFDEAALIHHTVEAMRRAYRDRAEYLGDSDYVEVPASKLTSKAHAEKLSKNIDPKQATNSNTLKPIQVKTTEGRDTTHFSIIDSEGNRVAATLSINYPFGSGFVPPGTGILLNDEMDDFSSRPGTPNVYGLVGNEANAIAPGKRMLSSMTPTFLSNKQRTAILGTPGGSRIITMILLATLAYEQGATAAEIVALPRFHHQYLPDLIEMEEKAISETAQATLKKMGHQIKPFQWTPGDMQVLLLNHADHSIDAASDPRGMGAARFISD